MSPIAQAVLKSIDRVTKALGDCRIELIAARRELVEAIEKEREDTPVRPPSQAAFKAFQASADFSENAAEALKKK